ncbi:cell division protein SepF [Actinosynnema pretiosum subsp. pretiosum]|uniref:Cell division protein SepF n=2 Tax=Actinosynnema TaxID=40566 RepID=C6WDD3_ACTMD|nr:cell division protein SepF [Actinosynnema mirum]ACU39570.1 protein of unknown function DUF552 [Actinosynnema mirum DSM 43827]AXX33078.1 hypothetical protein APASM_5713 [Actinosynnema pretiosum subsp. pretiosum]QUF03072.1 cell division protein SepF [Actinosynnema pretiosum subsp. pretiosum]
MSGFHKLKAYFGMVPAEYADDPDAYEDDRGGRYSEYRSEYPETAEYETYPEQRGRRRSSRSEYRPDPEDAEEYESDARARSRRSWSETPVHGALAIEAQREPAPRPRALPAPQPQQPAPAAAALGRITTLNPRSYNEARAIGEHYRDGTPVIMNLTDMDDADAKRLVDFAAGLAFALRGSIDKVTNKVFLLSPPNIDVTAEDRRRLAEGGFLNHG